ncbi:hypothetical protein H8M03_06090 [Sphingomonas sabuli]|uniref:Calcium-binding protein n=1 Tax=Sphingomonas sabuli TaxID=2764186 RepID=A0A7G9L5I4_9SPHN|nr:calcium-binding protein [Sphingomonas sabuli]QNM83883.1 hypothetical protein H8M03_06090 [Sphingomonas sabuli]
MARFVASGDFDMDAFYADTLMPYIASSGEVVISNEEHVKVEVWPGFDFLEMLGSFTDFDDRGYPIFGTITRVAFTEDSSERFFVETSIDVQAFNAFMGAEDVQGLFAAILAGDDEILGAGGAEELYGYSGNDVIRGDEGNDRLHGGDGADLLSEYTYGAPFGDDLYDGGTGIDRVSYFSADDAIGVTVDLNISGAQNTGQGSDTFVSIEQVTATRGDDTVTGDGAANWFWTFGGQDVLSGNGGDDRFTVGAGDKVIDGGTGIDTADLSVASDEASFDAYIDATGVTVSLALQGSAQWVGTGYWTLNNVENLGGDFYDDTLTGNGETNILAGGVGNDVLTGAGGDDWLYGDGYFRSDADGNQIVDGTFDVNDWEVYYADDTLNGGAGNDHLFGYVGNDVLNGGAGNDEIDGGDGIDRLSYAGSSGAVTVDLAITGAQATGGSGNDTLTGIENVDGSGFADQVSGDEGANALRGMDGDDRLIGRGGNDVLNGGLGADIMRGGTGNDTYYVDNVGDRIAEDAGQGTDTVISSVTFALRSNFENLTLTGSAVRAAGNNLANVLSGTGGVNVLNGGFGADIMRGGGGNDIYYVETAGDRAVELADAGRDRVYTTIDWTLEDNVEDVFARGSAGIALTGNALDNVIIGNAANNTLDGRAGADDLRGANGADTFVFRDGEFGGTTGSTADRVMDFSQAQGDRIDLHFVDASSGADGDQAFAFIGAATFSGTAGELRYQVTNGTTYVSGDTNGDGAADFMIRLDGGHTLVGGDFIL